MRKINKQKDAVKTTNTHKISPKLKKEKKRKGKEKTTFKAGKE